MAREAQAEAFIEARPIHTPVPSFGCAPVPQYACVARLQPTLDNGPEDSAQPQPSHGIMECH